MILLYLILCLAVGILIGYLLCNGKQKALTARNELLAHQLATTKNDYEQQLATLKEEHKSEVAALKDDFKEQTKSQYDFLRDQFAAASERTLKARAAELEETNVEQLAKILTPLTERITQMREAVEKNEKSQTEATTRLDTAIKFTITQTEKLGKTTDNLVSALAHDNKYQGSFGELQLRQLLEDMGFVRDVQFEEQVTIRDDSGEAVKHDTTGSRMQPDVVLHFPDKRDIIIDAKTSMTAFLRYNDPSLSDEARQQALKDHIIAIKAQVKSLAKKDYWRQYNQKGIKLDFVVMFVPSEGALQLATTEEPSLWEEAFNQGVFITGPQNLYALLRLLEMSWKQVAQMENQQNIIACADEIVRRVQIFYERFLKVDNALKKTQKAFDDLSTAVAPTGQSIVTSARKLLTYGARESTTRHQPLPQSADALLLEAEGEETPPNEAAADEE